LSQLWQDYYASSLTRWPITHERTDGQHAPNAYCVFRLQVRRHIQIAQWQCSIDCLYSKVSAGGFNGLCRFSGDLAWGDIYGLNSAGGGVCLRGLARRRVVWGHPHIFRRANFFSEIGQSATKLQRLNIWMLEKTIRTLEDPISIYIPNLTNIS